MFDRIFQNETSFEVSDKGDSIVFSTFDDYDRDLRISVIHNNWEYQQICFFMTPKEATALKNFLAEMGY